MNIIVLVKQVPDTETVIKVRDDGKGIVTDNIKYVVNPYDEFAIEEALKIKKDLGGEVVILSIGPDRAIDAIRTALAMGADRAVHINDPALENSDTIATAKILAQAIKSMSYDLILCGRQAIDDDSWSVGPALAEFLNIAHVGVVSKLEVGEAITATREGEGGAKEIFGLKAPAVISATKGLNEPRYPSLPGIMKAKKKPVEAKNLAALGINAAEVGASGSKSQVVSYSSPPERAAGKILEGEPEEVAAQLVKLLREEAKVI